MNELIKRILGTIKSLWGKWSIVQRMLLIGIVVAVVVGVIALFGVSSKPTMVLLFDQAIKDEAAHERIVLRINQEDIKIKVSPGGLIQVADEKTARRVRAMLFSENLVPTGMDPWAIFDRDRWSITDFERNVNFRRAQTRMITDHIRAIDDLDDADVVIDVPPKELFQADRKPITASVVLKPRPGSDIAANRKKIEGIHRMLKYAISGLEDENITIHDQSGIVINNFEDLADLDRLDLIRREQNHILDREKVYRKAVLEALQTTFSRDRVRDLNIKFDMNMSKTVIDQEEFFPVTLVPKDPTLPYDNSERVLSIPRSTSTSNTKWEGTGQNPEGPAGVEGQTPPAFKDMSNLYGRMTQETNVQNEEINKRVTKEEKSPKIDRVTISVNIDGTWKKKYDEKGQPIVLPDNSIEREYTPVPQEDLRAAQLLIRDAIGFDAARGDSVTVQNIKIDRTEQFRDEDTAYFRQKQLQTTILVFLSGLTVLLISFIIFRVISREMERRRRLAEDERARREQMLRESAIAQAEEDGVDVSISVEERTRMELLESVINMAREHPDDCAQLIRTWLLEE